jgi:hypothetical protein
VDELPGANVDFDTPPDLLAIRLFCCSEIALSAPGGAVSDLDLITAAEGARTSALASALSAIQTLQQSAGGVPDSADASVQAFQRQLFAALDSNFWSVVEQARIAVVSNQSLTGTVALTPDRSITDDWARVDETLDPGIGISFGEGYFDEADDTCRREVITHEYFHYVVGLQHFYGTTNTLEALQCPHHLTELVFDIALGEVGGCDDGAACF